jgi:hypothetical protein
MRATPLDRLDIQLGPLDCQEESRGAGKSEETLDAEARRRGEEPPSIDLRFADYGESTIGSRGPKGSSGQKLRKNEIPGIARRDQMATYDAGPEEHRAGKAPAVPKLAPGLAFQRTGAPPWSELIAAAFWDP